MLKCLFSLVLVGLTVPSGGFFFVLLKLSLSTLDGEMKYTRRRYKIILHCFNEQGMRMFHTVPTKTVRKHVQSARRSMAVESSTFYYLSYFLLDRASLW